jgi:hypothetical protein
MINESVDDEQNLGAQESRIGSALVAGFCKGRVVLSGLFQKKKLQICRDSEDLQGELEDEFGEVEKILLGRNAQNSSVCVHQQHRIHQYLFINNMWHEMLEGDVT